MNYREKTLNENRIAELLQMAKHNPDAMTAEQISELAAGGYESKEDCKNDLERAANLIKEQNRNS